MAKFTTTKAAKKITSWSYSRYSCWEQCPAKAKYKFIDKLPEPPAPAMERGIKIHQLAEDYILGKIKKMPEELLNFEEEFKELKKCKPMVEETWAFTKDWDETRWDDWAGCAVRIKTDAALLDGTDLYVIDHKTGKMRDGYEKQLDLYALGGMLKFPHIKKVYTQLWFLDSGDQIMAEYEASEMQELKERWDKDTMPMLNDTIFAPKPNYTCRWCTFSKSKGGPCKY